MNRRLLVEPLMTEAQAMCLVSEEDRKLAADFAPLRRCEYLTWRAVVRRELGEVIIGYDAVGAPVLIGCEDLHISISHGAGLVAVCISDAPCGVDVERLDRNYDRITSRYLSSSEIGLSTDPRFRAAAWSAKEVLYKLSAERELDLLADLKILAVGSDWIEGCIKERNPLRMEYRYLNDECVIVWYL